jgi:hypothetical protein
MSPVPKKKKKKKKKKKAGILENLFLSPDDSSVLISSIPLPNEYYLGFPS